MPRTAGILIAVAGCFVVAGAARASTPNSTYVVPSRFDFMPNEPNATAVVIHGAFFFLKAANQFAYSDPVCGYMYFSCQPGQEAMCRMQWTEIKNGIGNLLTCYGFGEMMMVSKPMPSAEGTPLGQPAPWLLGMGVAQGGFVDGKCQVALAMKCPLNQSGDMGVAPDLAGPPDLGLAGRDLAAAASDLASPGDLSASDAPAPTPDLAKPTADLAMSPPAADLAMPPPIDDLATAGPDVAVGPDLASPPDLAMSAPGDLATAPADDLARPAPKLDQATTSNGASGGGCACAVGVRPGPGRASLLGLALLGAALLRARRRR